jgi:hypothetical protein
VYQTQTALLNYSDNAMKYSILFLLIIGVFASFSPLSGQTCGDALFAGHDDLSPLHPCIKSYSGSSLFLTNPNYFCSGWAFQMMPGSGYIVLGPTVSTSVINYDYDSWTTATVTISTSTNAGGPWTAIQTFTPNNTRCNTTTTPTIAIGMYYRIEQAAFGGGGLGPLSIRNIWPETPSPVQLVSFVAARVGARVRLTWRTATEINNSGFDIERRSQNGAWESIAFIQGHGTVNTPQSYSYSDVPPTTGGATISYRLRQVDRDGTSEYSPVVTVSNAQPVVFGLQGAYPNPFNPSTTLSFSLPQAGNVTLVIIDRTGHEVMRLLDNVAHEQGSYAQMFNAKTLPSGEYYAWLYSKTESSVLRISLVK